MTQRDVNGADGKAKKAEAVRPGSDSRKPYEQPRLIEYGSIAKLTRGNSGVGTEGAQNRFAGCL